MSKRKRFIVEGEWSGYRSSQRRIVHRTVHTYGRESYEKLGHAIYYTDGTSLDLTIRDCKPREKVKEIRGYVELLNKCIQHGVNRVSDLPR